jgi:hypothetical protein
VRDVGPLVAQGIAPIMERLKASRRDAELTRQMLLALRYVLPSQRPNRRRPRLAGRDFLDDALRLAELVSDAEALDTTAAGRPIVATNGDGETDATANLIADGGAVPSAYDEELPPELESTLDRGRHRNRAREDARRPERSHIAPAPTLPLLPAAASLASLRAALPPRLRPDRPDFMGTGTFGGTCAIDAVARGIGNACARESPAPQVASVAPAARGAVVGRVVAGMGQAKVDAQRRASPNDLDLRHLDQRRDQFHGPALGAGAGPTARDLLHRR